MDLQIKQAKEILHNTQALLITAGAGMGVDSGLPDFRGNEGFWKAYPPMKKLGLSFSDMANPDWFDKDATLAWGFYGHRMELYRNTPPHAGFDLLLSFANSLPEGYFVFTSNVDGQFQKTGFSEERVLECHGSIHHLQCTRDCNGEIHDTKDVHLQVDMEQFRAISALPHCPACQALSRPNILMFGDWGWNPSRTHAQEERFERWLQHLHKNNIAPTIIEIGAGESVPTVRMLSEQVAVSFKGPLIRINPRDYHIPDSLGVSLPCGGLEGISKLMERM